MKVLVFDSGSGGEWVANSLRRKLPAIEFDFMADHQNAPYGNKSRREIIACATSCLAKVIDDYQIIVVACHTLTQVGIKNLREKFPNTVFVGFDPGLKLAQDLGFSEVTVFATNATLKSSNYQDIKSRLDITASEPDCSGWPKQIDDNTFDPSVMLKAFNDNSSQCLILACTHFFVFEDFLKQHLPNTHILNPTQAVTRQLLKIIDGFNK